MKRLTDVVLTCFFTSHPDWQRGEKWVADYDRLDPLIDSMARANAARLVIIHDCFDDTADSFHLEHVRIPPVTASASVARWQAYYDYLLAHPEIERVWCVDSTDVIMVNNPFREMQPGTLYTGDEPVTFGDGSPADQWFDSIHSDPGSVAFRREHAGARVLNAGLLGGDRPYVLHFIYCMITTYAQKVADSLTTSHPANLDSDMMTFNHTARTQIDPAKLVHGRTVNTVFKRYQCTQNIKSWWRHK